jgi:malonyl-CoA decarboxylase
MASFGAFFQSSQRRRRPAATVPSTKVRSGARERSAKIDLISRGPTCRFSEALNEANQDYRRGGWTAHLEKFRGEKMEDAPRRIESLPRFVVRLTDWRSLWSDVSEALGAGPRRKLAARPTDAKTSRGRIAECLSGRGGEVSARARTAALGHDYLCLSTAEQDGFLKILADEFGPDPAVVDEAMAAVAKAVKPEERIAAEQRLRESLESPRLRLLTQFNTLPDGVKFLVSMRARLLEIAGRDPGLKALEHDLKGLLIAWFDVGFLELQRITWRSPALVLEKIMTYEAVHAIRSWDDLKNRLDSDRRLYAFFHPRMADEPLIFLEVALVRGMTGNIQELLDEHAPLQDPKKADCAIFYSISNAQRGLSGVSFGNFLIKRVVDDLSRDFPNLKTFATLSPMPGFRAWLEKQNHINGAGEPSATALTRLAARYLTERRSGGRRVIDPVAHFHLSNGARIERLNPTGDRSENGQRQSCGMMVNYRYKLADIEANHEAYAGHGKVATAKPIKALLGMASEEKA